jgi:hypothetical protein
MIMVRNRTDQEEAVRFVVSYVYILDGPVTIVPTQKDA